MKKILAASLKRIDDLRGLLQAVHEVDSNGVYIRSISERTLVSEACFLKLFITLEEFLESTFLHYLTGKMSTAKWRPSKYAKPPSAEHANNMLLGSQTYVDWSTPDRVRKFADLYFVGGEPYSTALTGVHGHLAMMKTVRNSTAHLSNTTRIKLNNLYSQWTGNPTNGVAAYDMLMAPGVSNGRTFYLESEQQVLNLISSIANRS